VAFFPDSYQEVNGVANTSRRLAAFARDRSHPFLCVHAGQETRTIDESPTMTRVELNRGRMSFGLERDLRFDLRFWRHLGAARAQVEAFGADLIHITGPSDVGMLGAYLAHVLRLPLVASWHTNLHDFAERRLAQRLGWLPAAYRHKVSQAAGRRALRLVLAFYRIARVHLAPNDELAEMLRARVGRPVFLMTRGVDASLFTPARRRRTTGEFRVGYVGRLSPEKDVRLLAALEAALARDGAAPFRIVVVGDGSERPWLEARLSRAEFTGVLEGTTLAEAYANLDVLVFPSETDTYGNVVLEALASGVPAIVTPRGGPRLLVDDGVSGFVAKGAAGFADAVLTLMRDPARHAVMRTAARLRGEAASWDRVFEAVYAAYGVCLSAHRGRAAAPGSPRGPMPSPARLATRRL
jgi:glycosyltransferase involved in cell wall biosynthesis